MKKAIVIIIVFSFLSSLIMPAYASQMTEFLFQIGLKFYQQGRYAEALHEFKKALMVEPDYGPALEYIQIIQKREVRPAQEPVVIGPGESVLPEEAAFLPKEIIAPSKISAEKAAVSYPLPKITTPPAKITKKAISLKPLKAILLDSTLEQLPRPIEIEQQKSLIILGRNILRYLVTEPAIITVEKKGADELVVTGKGIGYTYLHVWDENGRWTTEWLGVFPKPEGPSVEEILRREESLANNFKLRYNLEWSSYESGRRVTSLERDSYSWSHGLNLTGQTPYGNLDSTASIRSLRDTTDLTYYTVGLTEGQVGPFRDFTLRGFDFSPFFSNLAFSGAALRGAMFNSPAFHNRFNYTLFWGREGGGRYGGLSPGLAKTQHSFLEGVNLSYSPLPKQNYKFTLVHGSGRDREDYLNRYGYDLSGNWHIANLGLGYEIANDSETFAHLFTTRYNLPKFSLSSELRNISKKYMSITGDGWRQGELGGLFNLSYLPKENLNINSTLDVYKDRLFPAEDNNDRWNEDFNWDLNYRIDPKTSAGASYNLQNELGRIAQYRYQSAGLSFNRTVNFIKDIYTYVNYYHQENKNFSSPTSNFINNRIYLGMRFNVISDLYYYLNKELNWLEEKYTDSHSEPQALEMGLNWWHQIAKSPFRSVLRFTYRDEEDATSALSFLSGEDYIEGYSELSYQPSPETQIYGSCRMRNIWSDEPSVAKRVEMDFNAGMRYLWDTKIRWDSVGNIEGYIFKDLNGDGLRQRDEPPVEGIKLWIGKDKSQVTDLFGYYRFKNIRGRKAFVNIDFSTLPSGFVLTVPAIQEISIVHHRTLRVDFGIISRSEISGFVFEDSDGNGQFSPQDKGIAGAIITLEDDSRAVTDATGRYYFPNASTGEHTLTLDLDSLPVYYLPQTAITKKITLFEGVTFVHNIPLKKIEE